MDDETFVRFERMRGGMSKQAYLVRAVMRSIKQDEHMRRTPGEKHDTKR